jgi:hypothetical protein
METQLEMEESTVGEMEERAPQAGLSYMFVEQLSYIKDVDQLILNLQPLTHYAGDAMIARLLNKRNAKRHTWLHNAIFERSVEGIKLFHRFGCDIDAKCHGTPPLHLVATIRRLPEGEELDIEAFQYLAGHSDLTARDDQGASITHILAEHDMVAELTLLQQSGPAKFVNGLLEARDRLGNKPLHRAALSGASNALQYLVLQKVDLSAQSHSGQSALHCVIDGGMTARTLDCWNTLARAGMNPSNTLDRWGRSAYQYALDHGFTFSLSNELVAGVPSLKTAVLTHPLCRKHPTCAPSVAGSPEGPPENTHRLRVVVDERSGVLRSGDLSDNLHWVEKCAPAAITDVLRVHEWSYVRYLQNTCAKLHPDPEQTGGLAQLDGDTTVGRDTYSAAMHAAGALTQGVDMVMKGTVRNAFAAVRPPGHHAGYAQK